MNVDKIYSRAPIWIQNLMVTGYGAKLYYERYFHRDHAFLDFLYANERKSADEIRLQQLDFLKKLLRHALEKVPYYRQQLAIDPESITSLQEIRQLPLLSKETLRTQGDLLLAQGYRPKELVCVHTSGTSGKSLGLCIDIASRRKCYSFFSRYHSWAGLRNSRNNVTFGGRTIVPQSQTSKEFSRYNAVMGNHLFSAYHMSEENLPYYLEKMIMINPQFIEAYPSAAFLLAKFMDDHGITGIKPKAVMTSGETLFDHQRDIIERVFGCRVFDQYGCTEQALFVSQCEEGTYHVHPEFGIVEVLDEDDRQVPVGEVGRVVCTSFLNLATPLIRYDLGDTAEYGGGFCACGRNFPILNRICGRVDDYIKTPSGRKIGRLDPIFKCVTSTKYAQIVQTDLHHITVNIVPGKNYVAEDGAVIVNELRKRVGDEICIDLLLVDELKGGSNGKFKTVVSLV